MRFLLAIALLVYSVSLMSQDLEFENNILKANQIFPWRFEADSIRTYFFNVDAEKINDFIQYEDNKLKLIDKLIALNREGALCFYKANELNYFIGSPMTYTEFQKQFNLKDGYPSGFNIDYYVFRIEKYYSPGISDQKHLLVIGPLAKINGNTQVLFWVHLFDFHNNRTIQKLKTKECSSTQTYFKIVDY